jgi:hypothetical protein
MPIMIRNSPARIAELICIYITELAQARQVPPWDPVEVRIEDLSQSDPHPVFVAPLAALVKGRLLEAVQQTGWRVLLAQGERPVAEVELSGKSQRGAKGGSSTLKVISLTRGPFTEATLEALSVAEKLPIVAKAKYELRFLKAPAVYFAALWLHGEKQDVLIPMVDPPGGLKKNRAYSEEQVIKALRGIAQQNQSFHDNFREPRPKRRRKGKRSA